MAVVNRHATVKGHTQYCKCSRTQGRNNNFKGGWLRPTCDLREPPEKAGGSRDSSQGHRHWQQPFRGAQLTMGTLLWASAFWKSSLYLISAGTQTRPPARQHQSWVTPGQVVSKAGNSLTHSKPAAVGPPRHKQTQAMDLPTSRSSLVQGPSLTH